MAEVLKCILHVIILLVCGGVGDGDDDNDDNLALRASNDRIGKLNRVFLDIMELINNHNTALMDIIWKQSTCSLNYLCDNMKNDFIS